MLHIHSQCLDLGQNVCQFSSESVVAYRYRELEEKLDYLQKSSAQRDRTEALLKQKDKDCAQVQSGLFTFYPHDQSLPNEPDVYQL